MNKTGPQTLCPDGASILGVDTEMNTYIIGKESMLDDDKS